LIAKLGLIPALAQIDQRVDQDAGFFRIVRFIVDRVAHPRLVLGW
jgi:hypothetical protein